MQEYLWLNWLIMLGSIAGLLWLGWKSSATVHADGDDESGFLIAGRSLGPFVGAATIVGNRNEHVRYVLVPLFRLLFTRWRWLDDGGV